MKTSSKLVMAAVTAAMALAACGPRDDDNAKKPDQGREETRGISNIDNVGYAGTAVRRKVDKALDENDQRKEKLDQAIEQQSQ